MSFKRYFSIAKLFLNLRFISGESHKKGVRILTNPQLDVTQAEFVPADDTITASCYKLRKENWCAK